MGHARALLAVESPSLQLKLFREVVKNGYSVRKVEDMAQQLKNGDDIITAKRKIVAKQKLPDEFNVLKNRLSMFFNAKVQLQCSSKGKGKISIPFANEDELENIISMFDKLKGM
jgi:ParB family chromosome partitioning protein